MKYFRVIATWFVHANNEELAILAAGNKGMKQVEKIEAKLEPMPSLAAKQPTGPVRED